MPSSNRASSNDSRNLVIALLLVIGGFLAFCGLGQSNTLVVALGVIVAAAGPVMIMVVNNRNKVRLYVHGTAVVEEITARPTQEGRSARGRLRLTITATGIRGVTVTGTDPAIPVDKWPERGALLPVQVLKGTPRKFTVQWDRVQTHQEVVLAEQRGGRDVVDDHLAEGMDAGMDADDYSSLNAHLNDATGGAYDPDDTYRRPAAFATTLPPDNTPTLTDLPRVDAAIEEPVGARMGAPVATVAPPAEQIPDAANRPSLRSRLGFPPSQAKPRHAAPAPPGHHPAEPLGATATATTFTEPGPPAPPLTDAEAESAAAPFVETGPPPAAETSAETSAEAVRRAMESEEAPATAQAEAPAVEDGPEADDPPTGTRQTVIGEEDEPIIMRLRSAPRPGGGQHRRPSPHPRTGPHDRVRRSRPGRTRPAPPEPPALPTTTTHAAAEPEALAAPPEPRPETAQVEDQTAEAYTIPEAGSLVPAPELDPEAGAEVEWWRGPDDPRPPAAFYPDRESEIPPSRGIYVPPPVIEGELAGPEFEAEPEAEADPATDEPDDAHEPVREPQDGTEIVDETAGPGPEDGHRSNGLSAWSSNGRGPVPVGAGLYSAPPVFRAPLKDDEDEDDEPVAPDPYATEHYLPADENGEDADALEAQPLSEGAVAEFLAAGPRRQPATPLDGVNGVSITLIVSDLQRSRRFYRDTLGLTELDSGDTSAVLETGSARVVLRRVADMPPVDRRVVHLNLDVPDVYEAYERLREQGVDFVHRPRVVPQGEQLELCSATFRDPDGHAIALTRWELRR